MHQPGDAAGAQVATSWGHTALLDDDLDAGDAGG
jgi:hypothetical protein